MVDLVEEEETLVATVKRIGAGFTEEGEGEEDMEVEEQEEEEGE